MTDNGAYPHLFSPLRIRHTTIPNRVMFAPVCPTWVRSPHEGVFTEQAVAYYEERARTGLGMIILGGHLINKDTIYTPLGFPGLWNDAQLEGPGQCGAGGQAARLRARRAIAAPRAALADAVSQDRSGASTRTSTTPTCSLRASCRPAKFPAGRRRRSSRSTRSSTSCSATRTRRGARSPPVSTASNFTSPTAICPGSSCRRSTTTAATAGADRTRTGCGFRSRRCGGSASASAIAPFIGYRINSTSFWEGDLEIEDIKRIHADFEKELDIDYVSVSAGVHHSWIHTPMTFEEGWEREYTRAIKSVATKPVLLVGRVSHPGVAENLLASGDADAILLARQMIADEQWMTKVKEGRISDIRRCVAANYCWRAVIRGSRVQCAYNPVVGREAVWGASSMTKVSAPRRVLVIGAGAAGLEYARVAAARGNEVVVHEREEAVGGHVRAYGALPNRPAIRDDRHVACRAGEGQRRGHQDQQPGDGGQS